MKRTWKRPAESPVVVHVASPSSRTDKIFLRCAQTAQILGIVVAVFGYIFTVRPVYQKQLLDEQIAQRTIELREKTALIAERGKELAATNAKLGEVTAQLSKAIEEEYLRKRTGVLAQVAIRASAECSGLMVPPPAPNPDSAGPPLDFEIRSISIRPGPCLQRLVAASLAHTPLRARDAETLNREVQALASALDFKNSEVRRQLEELPTKARANPAILQPLDDSRLTKMTVKLLSSYPDKREQFEFRRRLEDTGLAIFSAYRDEVMKKISDDLRSLDWDHPRH